MLYETTTLYETEDKIIDRPERLIDAHNKFHPVDNIFEGMEYQERYALQEEIYNHYANAMSLRDREPLEQESFERHFFEGGNYEASVVFGSRKDGFLLGNEMDGVFVPTHFAPATLRGGYRLIKGLLDEDVPTALFITEDLVETIEKMDGWKILPLKGKVNFRGQEVEKTLVINKWNVLPKLAVGQAQRVIKSAISNAQYRIRHVDYYIHDFGDKVKSMLGIDKANADDLDDELNDLLGEATLRKISDWENED